MYFPGHVNAYGQFTTNPSPTICGGTTGIISAGSTDVAGHFTAANVTCGIQFGSPFNAGPSCITQGMSLAGAAVNSISMAVTTTGFIVTNTISGAGYAWICIGNQ